MENLNPILFAIIFGSGGSGYPEPTGTKIITTNGTHDVKDFATAEVSVEPQYRVSGSTLYIGGMVEDEVLYL